MQIKRSIMRKLVVFAALLFTGTLVNAQDFGFGVKAGINLASIGGDAIGSIGGLGSRVSFHVGGVAEIPISEKLSVQPELLYSSQGSDWSFGSINNIKLDYLNLPILGKYAIWNGISAEAGPVVGFLISSNGINEDDFKKLDVGFGIGASYKLKDHLFFSLRYNKGIMNINNVEESNIRNVNNVFQVSAGYRF